MNDLNIKYDNGRMTIHLDAFFPTSQARLKKLMKVIDLDWEHKEDHFKQLQEHFNEQLNLLEVKRTDSGKKALEYKQKWSDMERIVKDKKKPSGVKLTKEELEKAKEDMQHFKNVYSASMSDFNNAVKQKEQFRKHIEILQQRK